MAASKIKLLGVLVALSAVAAGAAVALAAQDGGAQSLRSVPKSHVDVEALGSAVGVPADPAERAVFLRKLVLTLAGADAISVPHAQRALREIQETGTLGRSIRPVEMKVSPLASLPPQARVPAEVARFVAHVGELTHSKPADPGSVRLLRSSLGAGGGDVYGVTSAAGSPCFILTGYGGTCAGGGNTARSGVAWIIGGAHDGLPGIFVGLAADDVSSVRLDVDGASVPVSLRSNVAFAELPARAHDAIVTTIRAGGRTSSESLVLTG
jgi:hypothetical protein